MSGKLPFNSYNGSEPYLFISYAHKDDEKVFGVINALHERLYRVWYDEGIEVGANWPQKIATRLAGCGTEVIFVSKNSLASQNCLREVNYGVAQKKKSIVVMLDGSELPADMGMQLSVAPVIEYKGGEQTAAEIAALLDGSLIGDGVTGYERTAGDGKKKINKWFVASVVLVLLLAAAAVYMIGTMKGWFGSRGAISTQQVSYGSGEEAVEASVTGFTSQMSMELLLKSMDSRYIYICGNNFVSDARAIERRADGWYLGGAAVERGLIDSLAPFDGTGVTQLALVNGSLTSLEGIESLKELDYLDVSGNAVSDISPLTALNGLKTLRLLDIPADCDLSPLAKCPELEQVYVSLDMTDRIAPLVEAGIEVIVKQ